MEEGEEKMMGRTNKKTEKKAKERRYLKNQEECIGQSWERIVLIKGHMRKKILEKKKHNT